MTKINVCTRGSELLFYRAALSSSHQTLSYLSGPIRRHRHTIGSPWRRLDPGRQALLVLVHLRKAETLAEVAAGFGMGVTTAWRYIRKAITLLARRSPTLDQALRAAKRAGHAFVVLDGTLVAIDRVVPADRPCYSGKHRRHGMNIQVLAAPDGALVPYKGRNKPASQKDANSAHARLRGPGERANAQLKAWRILRRLRCCPLRAGQLVKAILTLQLREVR